MSSRACATTGFNVGGEQSGHIVLSDFSTTGDGLARGAAGAGRDAGDRQQAVSEVAHVFEPAPQLVKNVRFTGGRSAEPQAVQDAIAAAEKALGARGRLLVRKSGTEPLIRVMAEGDDPALVRQVVDDIVGVIADTRNAA